MEQKELGNDPLCLLSVDEFAYDALPRIYKEDHSLNFFIDVNGNLCAEHTLHEEEYVWDGGEWNRIK